MKFYALVPETSEENVLAQEYEKGREIGSIRIGQDHLFFRSRLKKYYIPYTAINRCYRRVFLVPAKMCCGGGEFQMENLVICHEDKEVAQVPIPSTRAAKDLMSALKEKLPHAVLKSPQEKKEDTAEA